MRKIYFLHIPKTGGSSINNIFKKQFCNSNYLDHIENNIEEIDIILEQPNFYLSGHIPYPRIHEKLCKINKLYKFVFIRNPYDHIASHISWIYNLSRDIKFLRKHPIEVQNLSIYLNKFNFSCLKDFRIMINKLPPYGIAAFDNRQTRYFSDPPDNNYVDDVYFNRAVSVIHKFDFIGFFENFTYCINNLSKKLNIEIDSLPVQNSNNKKLIDKDLLKSKYYDFLHNFIKHDLRLYDDSRNIKNFLYN